ncbi:hypothetical protein DN730_17020 [Marinomonas piezotolerans]|uniref:Outer membrane protein beta-barrel domain-containing protein n=1 Tax=Marinomonas piezotolerans TaxID=2213058 RepID=A0A370U556_9GAMM|nr:hypothetical protein [Marinomonas piezotolerans]RDL42897.1 hypothetical protein DN730_17020 [Marinomonas piezotolerans]
MNKLVLFSPLLLGIVFNPAQAAHSIGFNIGGVDRGPDWGGQRHQLVLGVESDWFPIEALPISLAIDSSISVNQSNERASGMMGLDIGLRGYFPLTPLTSLTVGFGRTALTVTSVKNSDSSDEQKGDGSGWWAMTGIATPINQQLDMSVKIKYTNADISLENSTNQVDGLGLHVGLAYRW